MKRRTAKITRKLEALEASKERYRNLCWKKNAMFLWCCASKGKHPLAVALRLAKYTYGSTQPKGPFQELKQAELEKELDGTIFKYL